MEGSKHSAKTLPPNWPYLRSVKSSKFNIRKQKFVQNFYELREECLKSGKLFEDPEFPCNESSLQIDELGPVIWKRPKELTANPQFVVNGKSRFDIKQGKVGDCWFLSTLASLTLHPELINRIVPANQTFQNNYAGIFYFRFWHYGNWVEVVIDDRLPVIRRSKDYLAFNYSSDNNEFWAALLEKAYAKLYGSYGALIGGLPDEAMENLTGGVIEKYFLDDSAPPRLFRVLQKCCERPALIACGIFASTDELREKGLVEAHAYSITSATTLKNDEYDEELIRIRNPWGNDVEWNGAWSDRSPEWQSVPDFYKKRLSLQNNFDGEFWMSFKDFCKYFDIVEICHYSPDQGKDRLWKEHIFEGKWIKGFNSGGISSSIDKNPTYTIHIKETNEQKEGVNVIIALMQKNIREEKRECLQVGFFVSWVAIRTNTKGKKKKEITCVNNPKNHFKGFREECERLKLVPGTYKLTVCTKDQNQEAQYVLRILVENTAEVQIASPPKQQKTSSKKTKLDIEGEKLYKEMVKSNEEVNWEKLQMILTKAFDPSNKKSKGFGKQLVCWIGSSSSNVNFKVNFSDEICKSLISAFDRNFSGELSLSEFICLWRDLMQWKEIFESHLNTRLGYELAPEDLQQALRSINMPLCESEYKELTNKYLLVNFDVSLIYAFHLDVNGTFVKYLETDL